MISLRSYAFFEEILLGAIKRPWDGISCRQNFFEVFICFASGAILMNNSGVSERISVFFSFSINFVIINFYCQSYCFFSELKIDSTARSDNRKYFSQQKSCKEVWLSKKTPYNWYIQIC